MTDSVSNAAPLPATHHAIQIVGPDHTIHNRSKPLPRIGPQQLLVKVEACGICFSDTKLLHAFTSHPRKSEVLGGLSPDELAEITSYVPGELPTVPGHEVACRIVAVGDQVRRHRIGERCLIQTDYRHLPTAAANAAFGYNFEGGLQEYVLLDERVIIEPGTGERFMIPVGEEPSASAVALLEPWACVEASYVYRERRGLLPAGRMAVVADEGHEIAGLDALVGASMPSAVSAVVATAGQRGVLDAMGIGAVFAAGIGDLPSLAFDDIVYFGADPDTVERLQESLAPRAMLVLVTAGASFGRPVAVDIGRVHYDLTRWTGTTGQSAADAYAAVPEDGDLRPGDRVAVIGAAGPMGLMHVVRALSGSRPASIAAIDVDDARLEHLAATTGRIARGQGIDVACINSRTMRVEPGFDYVALMVPAPPLVGQSLALAARGARINIFAGFGWGTRADVDLDRYVEQRCYLIGTSGSVIGDMKAVLGKLERGELDTNISVDAVTGFAGVADALASVEGRTSRGKIVVYPTVPELGLVRLSEMAERFPAVAAALDDGRWTKAAEEALLREADATPEDAAASRES
ncbi:MAG TPA: alcohol dehydrogenase catalytic domain-containing protein [Candidatus Limnocylindrales bacterium]